VEHHHDHQYPAKEVVARYRNSGRPERISAADRGYLKSYLGSFDDCGADSTATAGDQGDFSFKFSHDIELLAIFCGDLTAAVNPSEDWSFRTVTWRGAISCIWRQPFPS
jgi:hypothetical protein